MALEVLEKGLQNTLRDTLPAIGRAFRDAALPLERGTAENPLLLEQAMQKGTTTAERSVGVPFHGKPEHQPYIRGTEAPPKPQTIPEAIQEGKTIIGQFFRSHPNLGEDIKNIFKKSGWKGSAAKDKATVMSKKIYEPLQSDPVNQATIMHDYLVYRDEVAQALRFGKTKIRGDDITEWQTMLGKYQKLVDADPEIQKAIVNRQNTFDGIHADMVQRGWATPESHLDEYTPIKKLDGILRGLADQGGEDFRVKLQNAQFKRTGAEGGRETNLLLLEHQLLTDYIKKIVDHETFGELMSDKTLNFTSQFKTGDILPDDLTSYHPGPGMMGYMMRTPEDATLTNMGYEMQRLAGFSNVVTPGAYVMPKSLARVFKYYNQAKTTDAEMGWAQRSGASLARWLTVYNPGNTFLNIGSDLMLAMHGLPGEKAHPIGVLKAYPKSFLKGMELAFSKKSVKMKIAGAEVDLGDLVAEQGLGGSTFYHAIQGRKVANELARLVPESERANKFVLFDVLSKFREGAELSPRIAAGLEAWERTGNISEFGRLGRESTMTYGAGGPLASKNAMVRMMSPFIQYVGLSSSRAFDLIGTEGSRGRTVASIMALPFVCYQWNVHSDDYKQCEESLTQAQRDQAHIWVPDSHDPWNKVMRNANGQAIAYPMRLSILEDVMKNAGFGNLATRVGRVIEKRDTPGKFWSESGQHFIKNLTGTATVLPGLISRAGDVTTAAGRKVTGMDQVMRYLPISRPVIKGAIAAHDWGPGEAARVVGQELLGARQMNTVRKGDTPLDVDLIAARSREKAALTAYRRAFMNHEGDFAVSQAKQELDAAVKELQRIAPVIKEEHRKWRSTGKQP